MTGTPCEYVAVDVDTRLYVRLVLGGWQAEVRCDSAVGTYVGLVWQSGYYLTRLGAWLALRRYVTGGDPHCELPHQKLRWWQLQRVRRVRAA